MSYMELSPEVKLAILRYLPRKDVLSFRTIAKDFVPRDIVTLVQVMHSSCEVNVTLDLSPRARNDFSPILQCDTEPKGEKDALTHERVHEFPLSDAGVQVPDGMLEKARAIFLVGISRAGVDFVAHLAAKTGQVRNISTMMLFNLEVLAPLYDKNRQSLQGICSMEMPSKPDENGLPSGGFIDCKNLTCCQRLEDVVIMGTEIRNFESLPRNLSQLIMTSNLPLQQAEWATQNLLKLKAVMFGLDVSEFEKDTDLHPRVNGIFQNGVSLTEARAFMVVFNCPNSECTSRKLRNILAETLELFERTDGIYVEWKEGADDQDDDEFPDDEDDDKGPKSTAVASLQVYVDRVEFRGFPV